MLHGRDAGERTRGRALGTRSQGSSAERSNSAPHAQKPKAKELLGLDVS